MGKKVFYQVFVRNHSKEGTFLEVEKDLKRIKELGTDYLYLMPIFEIGLEARKGSFGSPYAIKDYFSISNDLGTMDDFISLVNKTHELGMKIILDMVFNHTAVDNNLKNEHPEYYYHKEDGSFGNKVGDWTDIIDLETTREDTQDYLISVLKFWISKGVDGFRFDVASLIPLSFFIRARKELGDEIIFFGETIDGGFVDYCKKVGFNPTPDKDLACCFQYIYNYNYFRYLEEYLRNECPREKVEFALKLDKNLPENLHRVHALENHDNFRVASYIKDSKKLLKITKWIFSQKGDIFIYAGQEYKIDHKPELFEKDPINFKDVDLEFFEAFKKLIFVLKNR